MSSSEEQQKRKGEFVVGGNNIAKHPNILRLNKEQERNTSTDHKIVGSLTKEIITEFEVDDLTPRNENINMDLVSNENDSKTDSLDSETYSLDLSPSFKFLENTFQFFNHECTPYSPCGSGEYSASE
ncbi:5548_t:CDS:2, partial [Entrophospora sp. SA101]